MLLCLGRTLLPEAWVLALHGHEHTTEEPAFATHPRGPARAVAGKHRALFTPKHTHCHEETFYNAPFQAAAPVVLPLPRLQASYRPLAVPTELASSATALRRSALRGPPGSLGLSASLT
ncbi:hypothetical protein HHL22_03275 [Hymenobacter sp. RP-2-7]|uniref:Uncharacterized protein n=1 Tax=Hymenobacter polaris TaxID=2682546 RepID=A0A7Y0ABD9_9BACT|nr:hypothetical protein [Hymenobacter polaris]NML64219.1 hypothetical protein [Hymenobacter polaris]